MSTQAAKTTEDAGVEIARVYEKVWNSKSELYLLGHFATI